MSPLNIQSFFLPKLLTMLFAGILLLIVVLYILFQSRLLIQGPQITLIPEPAPIQQERKITISGHAENITFIHLNGRPITTDEEGFFTESVVLENGYTIISITAEDRYGRETKVERSIVYTDESQVKNL